MYVFFLFSDFLIILSINRVISFLRFTIEVANPEERLFSVSAKTRRNQLVLNVKFPANYPNQVDDIKDFCFVSFDVLKTLGTFNNY